MPQDEPRLHITARILPHVKKGIYESGMSMGAWIEEAYARQNTIQDQITLLEIKEKQALKEAAQFRAARAELETVFVTETNKEWFGEFKRYRDEFNRDGLLISAVETRLCHKFRLSSEELYNKFRETEAGLQKRDKL